MASPVRRHCHSASTISSGMAMPISAKMMWKPSESAICALAAMRSEIDMRGPEGPPLHYRVIDYRLSGRGIRGSRWQCLPRSRHRLLLDARLRPVAHAGREDLPEASQFVWRERHLVIRRGDRLELALDDVGRERAPRDPARERVGRIQLVALAGVRHLA